MIQLLVIEKTVLRKKKFEVKRRYMCSKMRSSRHENELHIEISIIYNKYKIYDSHFLMKFPQNWCMYELKN